MVSFTLLKSVNGHCMCFVLSKFNSLYQFRKLHWPFDIKAAKNQLLRLFFLHSAYISLPMEGSKFHSTNSVLCLFFSRTQSLLASNWHISSNIQWPDILVSWFRIVACSTAINPNFLTHFRIYSTQHAFSSGEERSRKEIRNWEAFLWSNKWKIIKNFGAIAYFQLFKTAHFSFKVTILQFFPPPPMEPAPNFPSNTDIPQMFSGGNKSLLQEPSSSKSPAKQAQSEMQNWTCDHVLLAKQRQELGEFSTNSYKERPRCKIPWAEQVGASPRHFFKLNLAQIAIICVVEQLKRNYFKSLFCFLQKLCFTSDFKSEIDPPDRWITGD